MSKALDRVLQPDGSYKWEEVELIHSTAPVEPKVCPAPEPLSTDKSNPEEGVLTANLQTMTKSELETYGRSIGIELDKRHTKVDLIAELEKFISAN